MGVDDFFFFQNLYIKVVIRVVLIHHEIVESFNGEAQQESGRSSPSILS